VLGHSRPQLMVSRVNYHLAILDPDCEGFKIQCLVIPDLNIKGFKIIIELTRNQELPFGQSRPPIKSIDKRRLSLEIVKGAPLEYGALSNCKIYYSEFSSTK